jgi:D-alanyl-D-alanine carboxypeptidase (penicillin-binding protein 5/6)
MKMICSLSRWLAIACLLLWGMAGGAAAFDTSGFQTTARNVYIQDYETGAVLYDKLGEAHIPTASMSKMMTAYVVFEQLRAGKITMATMMPVSKQAWSTGGSKMFLPLNAQVSVEDLIRGMIIQSGNDACIALAEGVAGSESQFVDMMNAEAQRMGLKDTHFANVTGLPDPNHYSSAHDLAVIGEHLIRDFPEYYHYFSQIDFTYNNIKQGNRNPLLYKGMGVDGIKTGHTDEAGFCLTASAKRGATRIVAVMTGLDSMNNRSAEGERIVNWALDTYQDYPLFKKGDGVGAAPVWLGTAPGVLLQVDSDLTITLPRIARHDMKATLSFDGPVKAPVARGQQIGTVTITAPGIDPISVPVVATSDVPALGTWGRMMAALHYMLSHKQA